MTTITIDAPTAPARGTAAEFIDYVCLGIELGLLDPRLGGRFHLPRLGAAIVPERDALLHEVDRAWAGRHLLVLPDGQPLESVQFAFMRVAMGLSLAEPDPTTAALSRYDALSRQQSRPDAGTLRLAGTAFVSWAELQRTEPA